MPEILDRSYSAETCATLTAAGVNPVLARVLAARGVASTAQLDSSLAHLAAPSRMRNLERMAAILADAIAARQRLLIVADYDSDGATACAVGMLALREMGAQVDYIVPNRFEFGYGLTPEIVRLAAARRPDFLITVDNGIASVDGVEEARRLGLQVLVTDHHLPGERLPDAACIVDPNQPGCSFPSKHLAGVGVMFYVMLQLRAELRSRGAFRARAEPNLAQLLDLVALGTVADVVRLDENNRRLVAQGLARIRAGRSRPGIEALLHAAGRDATRASTYDLAFVLGPRLNAAGRLEDMAIGIECLISADPTRADALALRLDELNRERRSIETHMHDAALAHLEAVDPGEPYGLALYDPSWHQGVIGILAARIRERFHRPVIAFAPGQAGELKGSGRSIPALHLRDALDLVDKRYPGLIQRFGGHAAAAGLSIRETDFERFRAAFDAVLRGLLSPADLELRIETDGPLAASEISLQLAETLDGLVWGQGFPPPRFRGDFLVAAQRVAGGRHLRLRLTAADGGAGAVDAVLFGHAEPLPDRIRAAFRLDVNLFNGSRSVQLVLEHWEPSAVVVA
ncbi:MAG TPA: single-stranded-DNA-specific exonuclease RecJ [Burkholderiales bacterium]|nr:single-stranded-DNA-specific exonuclease RecJ [Burkholderiales bacterium]